MRISHITRMIVFILSALILLSACSKKEEPDMALDPHSPFTSATAVSKVGDVSEEVRGVWIASVYNINFPSSPDLKEKKLKSELDYIVDKVKSYNMNTIFFQVHPAADALYRSDIFPVSEYLYSDGILHFDPLEYMTEVCHENGITLYAWVNPLRVSVNSAKSAEDAKAALPYGSPGTDDSLTTFFGDGKLYFNCGVKEVRDLTADAVKEIASRYDVDGIVFDDYFYPYPANDSSGKALVFDDSEEHAASGSTLSLEDWRRDNVNKMIKQCYDAIKSADPDKKFGVAPFGIWQNDNGTNGGSATAGMEAYSALYCDASAWIKGKYVDFISPQLYWECSSSAAPFEELANFWNDLTDGTNVDLIISHAIYRYDDDWEDPKGELVDQIDISRELISYKGSILYGFDSILNKTSVAGKDTLEAFKSDVYYYHSSGYPDGIQISTDKDASVEDMHIIFSGFSDPDHALTVNGKTVSRKPGGYFECRLKLEYGENIFLFSCGETEKTVTIIKNEPTDKD